MTGRAVPEWIGKTPDTKVPDYVALRIFNAHKGICHISGRKIRPSDKWELEHVIPLSMGGEHRESNLAPALADKHKAKTKAEAKARAHCDAAGKRHVGIKRQSRGFGRQPSNARDIWDDLPVEQRPYQESKS